MAEKESKTLTENLVEWGKSLCLAFVIALLILKFIAFFAVVPTGSMIPTIQEGDRIVVWKCLRYLDWENRGLTHGDMVVFDATDNMGEDKLLVKRVIGMGGDTISIDNGIVYRNGEKVEEPYVKNKDSFFMKEFTVPEGEIFALGDNRPNSYDCRFWDRKTVPIENVVGEVTFLFP